MSEPAPAPTGDLTGPVEVVGAGLLGTSIGLACRRAGLEVLLSDVSPENVRTASGLGAGRARKEDPVQAAAGVTWTAGVGDGVEAGQPLFTLHTDTPERIARAREALVGAVDYAGTAPQPRPVVLERIGRETDVPMARPPGH